MSENTKIEWTDATWNPMRGCTKISPGCAHCYAETFAERFRGVPGHPFEFGFDLRLVPDNLGAVNLRGIHWVIVGGESGPGARPMFAEWVRRLCNQCHVSGVPFFFKQWGGVRKKETGRQLDGRTHNEFPEGAERVALSSVGRSSGLGGGCVGQPSERQSFPAGWSAENILQGCCAKESGENWLARTCAGAHGAIMNR